MKKVLVANALSEDEVRVPVATSDDVPRLVTERESREQRLDKQGTPVPALPEACGVSVNEDVPLEVPEGRSEVVGRLAG